MKGHNYANPPCRRCGRIHIPNRGKLGKRAWNKGLKGSQIPWNKGLTVQTDKRVAANVYKSAQTIRLQFKKGRIPPNKGKIAPWMLGNQNIAKRFEVRKKISDALKGRKKPWIVSRNKSEQMRNFNRQRLLDSWEDIDGPIFESPEHRALKMLAKEFLHSEGFAQVEIERHVKFYNHCYKLDVYAKNDDERVAVECGNCSEEKLHYLNALCSTVIHIPYPRGGF